MNDFIAVSDVARRVDRFVLMISRNTQKIVPSVSEGPDRLISTLDIMYLDQWSGLPYRAMVEKVARILGHSSLVNNTDHLCDATGVGDPVVQMFHETGVSTMPVIVTAGKEVREVYQGFGSFGGAPSGKLSGFRSVREFHVPKADLVAAGELMLQNQRVGLAKNLKWTDELQKQLVHLSPKPTPGGATAWESDSARVHDDIAFCFILTAWWALRRLKDGLIDTPREREQKEWDPIEHM